MGGAFYEPAPQGVGGLRVRVRLRPAGGQDAVLGVAEDVDGQVVLKASVTKPPEGGKANQALIKLLAKEWRVAKSALEVLQGQTSRNKVLGLAGEAQDLSRRLDAWAVERGFRT